MAGPGQQLVNEREARRLLAVLELEELACSADLDRQYKRLIKHYHPDLNPQAREWAHDRSQAVIGAARSLREYLERVGPLLAPRPRLQPEDSAESFRWRQTVRPERDPVSARVRSQARVAAGRAARPMQAEAAFQMIDGRRLNYALPIQSIVKIIGTRDPGVHRASPAPYCALEGAIYPLHNLEGEALAWEDAAFIVLLKSPHIRVGIVLPREARFGSIESYRHSELELPARSGGAGSAQGVWIRHGLKLYLCPAELLAGIGLGRGSSSVKSTAACS